MVKKNTRKFIKEIPGPVEIQCRNRESKIKRLAEPIN